MSFLKRLKRKVGWESNTPRCETCVHYLRSKMYLIDSLPRINHPMCKLHDFQTRTNALCNSWVNKEGETLDVYIE